MFSARLLSNELRRKSTRYLHQQQQMCWLERGTNTSYNQQSAASIKQFKRHTHSTNSSKNNNTSSFMNRLHSLKSNGTPEILLGSTILLIASIDYTLQQRDTTNKSQMMEELQAQVSFDAKQLEMDNKKLYKKEKPTIMFTCLVKRVPPNFDGHKCLVGVEVGDILNVIEEGVGPGGQYNLCFVKNDDRDSRSDEMDVNVGWFPCSCLEVIKE